jgi:hypothetical protein
MPRERTPGATRLDALLPLEGVSDFKAEGGLLLSAAFSRQMYKRNCVQAMFSTAKWI